MHELSTESIPLPQTRAAAAVAPWWHTALLAALLAGGSFFSARQARHTGLGTHHAQRYLFAIAAEWILLLLTWWGLRLRRVRASELLGFRRGFSAFAEDFASAAVFWIVAIAVLAVIAVALRLFHLAPAQKAIADLAPRTATEMLLWIALSLTAGFCEEFLFRGYFLRQFASIRQQIWLGVLCSSLLFGISHGYEGAAGMIAITAYGALFCVLALMRRSLRPGMIAHAWHDIFSGAMLVLLRHVHPF